MDHRQLDNSWQLYIATLASHQCDFLRRCCCCCCCCWWWWWCFQFTAIPSSSNNDYGEEGDDRTFHQHDQQQRWWRWWWWRWLYDDDSHDIDDINDGDDKWWWWKLSTSCHNSGTQFQRLTNIALAQTQSQWGFFVFCQLRLGLQKAKTKRFQSNEKITSEAVLIASVAMYILD